jgi:hypothetical protein
MQENLTRLVGSSRSEKDTSPSKSKLLAGRDACRCYVSLHNILFEVVRFTGFLQARIHSSIGHRPSVASCFKDWLHPCGMSKNSSLHRVKYIHENNDSDDQDGGVSTP